MEKPPKIDFPLQKSLTSGRRFKSNPNLSTIGPHVELTNHIPLNFETIHLSDTEESQDGEEEESSSASQNTQDNQICSSICSIVNAHATNRSFVLGMLDMVINRDKRKLGEQPTLKQIVMEQKVKMMVKNFVKKLARNNINSPPVDYTPFFSEKQLGFLDTQGIQINDYFQIAHFIFSIFLIIILTILSTLCVVFRDIETSITFNVFSKISLIYFVFEIFLNLITVKFQEGKRLGTLRQIIEYYINQSLVSDVLVVCIFFVDQIIETSFSEIAFLRLVIFVKLSQVFQRVQRLQVFFIRNFYYEQYWSLIKVFLFNFSLAHILAIFLIGMASINMEESWMDRRQLLNSPWYEKYFWAYYWATTIMLTVGFGDLTATNYQEAICLTFIEMISCIALAYNINCVGMLISNIRAQDLEKGKNFKIFYKLSRKNDLSQDLEWRINNYIEQSSNIKKKFNYEEENQFVDKLPQGLKAEFLKESNKKIFKNLPFFRNLMERTVFTFAQKIEMHICHPEEIIQHLDDPHNLLILKGGQIGFTCKKPGCRYNSTVIDQLKVLNIANPILISLGFIRNPRMNYEIKSLAYSILYFMDYESILSILKSSQMDYELYCLLKDKALNMPDDFELFDCEICQDKHTKFTCPKLHFIPIKQHITDRYIYRVKQDKSLRSFLLRYQYKRFRALEIFRNNLQKTSEKTSKGFNTKKMFTRSARIKGLVLKRRFQDVEDGAQNPLAKQISEIKDYFSKNTAELIKQEMTRALYIGEGHDEVWIIETDKMKNYKNYFENDNSCNLIDKFSIFKRQNTVFSEKSSFKSSRNFLPESRRGF